MKSYSDVFKVEMEGWCYGIEHYPGEIYPELIYAVIRELHGSFKRAIEFGVVIDMLELSSKIAKATKYLVGEKEITFCMLSHLPSPMELNEDGMYTLAAVIDRVELVHPGVLERMQRRWKKVQLAA